MGVDQQPSISIDSFTPPKNRAPLIVGIVVALVLAGLGYGAFRASQTPVTQNTPTPTVTTGQPTTQVTGNAIVFHSERDNADGVWRIDSHRWTDRGLELTMTIEVTKGTLNYAFFCLDNKTTDNYDPVGGGANSLNQGSVSEGQKVSGVVIFDKPRGDTTVILANEFGRQITALVATG